MEPGPFSNSTVLPPAVRNLTNGKKSASTRLSMPYVRLDEWAVTRPTARASVSAGVSSTQKDDLCGRGPEAPDRLADA